MSSYKTFFKGKNVLVLGLGPDCEAVSDVIFLIKSGANVSVADMRSEARIVIPVKKIQAAGMVSFTFGNMSRSLVQNIDMILKSKDIPDTVPCIEEAIDRGIPVEIASTLFLRLAPPITLLSVIGQCAKGVVFDLIEKILKPVFSKDQTIWVMDHTMQNSPLNILKKIKKGDIVLNTIDHREYSYYVKARISPHVAVLTTPINSDLLSYQTYNNFLIAKDSTIDILKSETNTKAKMLRTSTGIIPASWNVSVFPKHIKENMALALRVSELFKIDNDILQEVFETFKVPKGNLDLVKSVMGVDFYNDNNSICPEATITAVTSLGADKNILLILGGVYAGDDMYEFTKIIPKYVKKLIFIPGSGTMTLHKAFKDSLYAHNIKDALRIAKENAQKGDKILFSPSFPPLNSIKERNQEFLKAIKKI